MRVCAAWGSNQLAQSGRRPVARQVGLVPGHLRRRLQAGGTKGEHRRGLEAPPVAVETRTGNTYWPRFGMRSAIGGCATSVWHCRSEIRLRHESLHGSVCCTLLERGWFRNETWQSRHSVSNRLLTVTKLGSPTSKAYVTSGSMFVLYANVSPQAMPRRTGTSIRKHGSK